MAKKRNIQVVPNQNEPAQNQQIQNQQGQMHQGISPENLQKLKELQTLKQAEEIRTQEEKNKSHDTEFTDFSPVNGNMGATLGIIGEEEVAEAWHILLKYKEEKAALEGKISENEEFWKMNHWDVVYKGQQELADKRGQPRSGWLFNTIINKHADAMDNYPEADILPRAKDDEQTAKILSEVIPVILEQNDYEQTYSDAQWYKCKNGTSVQGVFWNNDKNNGLGDVEIKKIDLLNLFWKGGITDIQDSPNLFHVTMMDNDEIKARYPDINVGGSSTLGLTTIETYQQGVDTSGQTAVIDWYYKRRVSVHDELGVPKVNTVLHYCKFCNGQVIYASENDPNYTDKGWYDHGKYPFVFDTLFPMEGTVTGMGYIDLIKDDQMYIDKLQQAILESAITNARPRYFIRNDGAVNEAEFTDISKPIVHTDGNLGENDIRPIENSNFNSVYETVYLNKIEELKDTSGNTASSQGQTSSVTSASGIASLQEAAGKLSRDANATSYRAYKEVVDMVIEMIRQFYDAPRCFRIVGEFGHNQFVNFDNSGLLPQSQGQAFGIDLGSRLPIMDIDVRPQKKNSYTKESQNQTALNLYNLGFFAPANADSALACLSMMDFDNIEPLKEIVQQNGTLFTQVQQLQAQLVNAQQLMAQMGLVIDAQNGTNLSERFAGQTQRTINSARETKKNGTSNNQGKAIKQSKGSLSSQAAEASRGASSVK